MNVYRAKEEALAVKAIRHDGLNVIEIYAMVEGAGAEVFVSQGGRLLIADANFPFWLDQGEWLTVAMGSDELDAWGDSTFHASFDQVKTVEGATP